MTNSVLVTVGSALIRSTTGGVRDWIAGVLNPYALFRFPGVLYAKIVMLKNSGKTMQ